MTNPDTPSAHVFGPVPSRRLGRSLGVDLIPHKTCPYDCLYCQIGRTTDRAIERKEWVPLRQIIAELRTRLRDKPDYITLSGSGEPTLYARLGELIAAIKAMTRIPVAVLTNGALLSEATVVDGLREADLVVPSLDAGDAATFEKVNRPHPSISFERMTQGLIEFRATFPGKYWLEVFLLRGITDTVAQVDKMAAIARDIAPDRVQLNTVTRPPAETTALPLSATEMERFVSRFPQPAEVIAHFHDTGTTPHATGDASRILDMLLRRPCTAADIAAGLGLHPHEVAKHVGILAEQGLVKTEQVDEQTYYAPATG